MDVLNAMGLQRDLPITGIQAGGLFVSLCANMTQALGAQRQSIDEQSASLRAEYAGMIAKLASDVDDSLRRNATATDAAYAKVESEIGDFDLRVANNKMDFDHATEATRTRVAKMEDEFQKLMVNCNDTFSNIQSSAKASVDDANRQLAQILSGSGGGFGGSSPPQRQERDRQIFDPRDYKIADLGSAPSLGFSRNGNTRWRCTSTPWGRAGRVSDSCSSNCVTLPCGSSPPESP